MKVSELIKKLSKFDGDAVVCVEEDVGLGVHELYELESVTGITEEEFDLYEEVFIDGTNTHEFKENKIILIG